MNPSLTVTESRDKTCNYYNYNNTNLVIFLVGLNFISHNCEKFICVRLTWVETVVVPPVQCWSHNM